MRYTMAIVFGWLIVLLASTCFGQSYNGSHFFRSRPIARPTAFQSGYPNYYGGAAFRSTDYRPRDLYRDSYYRESTYRSSPSYYSRRLGEVSNWRTTASFYDSRGLDASRSLYYGPGVNSSSYYSRSSYGSSFLDFDPDYYGYGRRLRGHDR
jgi:hypothetical protein